MNDNKQVRFERIMTANEKAIFNVDEIGENLEENEFYDNPIL